MWKSAHISIVAILNLNSIQLLRFVLCTEHLFFSLSVLTYFSSCDEADVPRCDCGSGWLFSRTTVNPRSNIKQREQFNSDMEACHICDKWKCDACNPTRYDTLLQCENCYNVACKTCVDPTNSQYCPLCNQTYLCMDCESQWKTESDLTPSKGILVCEGCQRPNMFWAGDCDEGGEEYSSDEVYDSDSEED